MSVVLDTTVLIDHLRGLDAAVSYLRSLRGRPVASEVSRIEVWRGLRSHERQTADRLFSLLAWRPLDAAIAARAGELGRSYRRSHDLDIADLAVAATAEGAGLPVATSNVRHFPMFHDLQRPY